MSSYTPHQKSTARTHQNTTVLLQLMFCLLILGIKFPLGYIHAIHVKLGCEFQISTASDMGGLPEYADVASAFQIAKICTLTFLLKFSQVANSAKVMKILRFQNVVTQVALLYFVSNKKLLQIKPFLYPLK